MKLTIHNRGIGGIEEMKKYMDDSQVMFGLLRFVFGHGSFARVKFVFVHLNGEKCSIVKRGRYNASKGIAAEQIGSCHTDLQYQSSEDMTVDGVLEHLHKVCISDGDLGSGQELTVTQMKKDMEVMLEKAKEDMEKLKAPVQEMSNGVMLTWKEMAQQPSWSECLKMVRADMGPFNWMLLSPNARHPEMINAGAGSVTQMRGELQDNQVAYGLLRMGFGTGQFRRSKWIFIHWSGENVPAVKRGKYNTVEGDMKLLLGAHNVAVAAQGKEEFTLEEIISKVQRSVVTDGDASESDMFSMDAFLEALDEEQKAAHESFQDDAPEAPEEALAALSVSIPLADGMESVRSDREPYNWLLTSFA